LPESSAICRAARLFRCESLGAVLALALACCGGIVAPGDQSMDTFYQDLSTPIEIQFPRVSVAAPRRPQGLEAARAPDKVPAGYLMPFANDHLNSRVSFVLPQKNWEPQWKCALQENIDSSFVVQKGDGIIVQGARFWQLIDANTGQAFALDLKGNSPVAWSGAGGFYFGDRNGFIAYHGADGRLQHRCSARLKEQFSRLMIRRTPDAYFVASLSDGWPPFGMGDFYAFEKITVGDVNRVDEARVLLDSKRAGMLIQKKRDLTIPVVHERITVLATRDRLYLVDEDLKVRRALTGEFEPLSMSADEEGRLYLVVQLPKYKALWIVTPEGSRLMSFTWPADFAIGKMPPVVGYDHQAYVAVKDHLVAVHQSGRMLWEHPLGGKFAGATVTGDDNLLVSEGSRVVVYDLEGKSRVLFDCIDQQLSTPPVLTEKGRLLVASDRTLFCLH
jgi:hypothetical protein